MAEDLSSFLPLSPATLHILLALAGQDRHGYGIMQEVARQSEGQYKLGPGTLYDNLEALLPADPVWPRSSLGGGRAARNCGPRSENAIERAEPQEGVMTRSLYRCLLWLHPPAFRQQFAGEMLWIFDEAARVEGAAALILDAIFSLLRQWVVGCGLWKVAAAVAGGVLQMVIVMWLIPTTSAYVRPMAPAQAGQLLSHRDLEFPHALLLVVSKEVVLDVEGPSATLKDPRGNEHAGASGATKINRQDFGLNWNRPVPGGVLVGNEVSITVDTELIRRAE